MCKCQVYLSHSVLMILFVFFNIPYSAAAMQCRILGCRNSRSQMFFKIGILKNFTKTANKCLERLFKQNILLAAFGNGSKTRILTRNW